jgi:hypothetical protein
MISDSRYNTAIPKFKELKHKITTINASKKKIQKKICELSYTKKCPTVNKA